MRNNPPCLFDRIHRLIDNTARCVFGIGDDDGFLRSQGGEDAEGEGEEGEEG